MIGHSSRRGRGRLWTLGKLLAALRGDPLPASLPSLLLLSPQPRLLLSGRLLLLPQLPLLPVALSVLDELWGLFAKFIELEGKCVVDRGLEMFELVHSLLGLLLHLALLHLLDLLLFGLRSQELLLKIVRPAHPVLDERGQDEQRDETLQQSNMSHHLNLSVIESRHPPIRESLVQHPVVHCPSPLILEDRVDGGQLL